jgi:hypothetical protein
MKHDKCIAAILLSVFSLLAPGLSRAQSDAAAAAPHQETTQDFIARLNPQQKQQFDDAGKAYSAHRFAESLALHQTLLKDFPGDPILLKFEGEDYLEGGNAAAAMAALKPLASADPYDWQAAALLVHACAEAGDKACRDQQMAHMLELHSRGITPPRFQQYPVESVKLGDNTLLINTSIVPWGMYKIYALGKITDGSGKLLMSITLESSDFDQPGYAKEHPEDAAKGMRRFSIDTYAETGTDSAGNRTQTQGLYKFIDGQPPYDTIREEFVKIASGRGAPVASRPNLKVP